MFYLHSEYFPLTISPECPEKLSALISSTIFSELITTQPSNSAIKYQVTEIDKKYYLFRNKRLTHRNRTIEKIIYALEWQIVSDLIRQNKRIMKFALVQYEQFHDDLDIWKNQNKIVYDINWDYTTDLVFNQPYYLTWINPQRDRPRRGRQSQKGKELKVKNE
ncbi:MAG: hypothetical protein L6422_03945 [Candidatus Marinimicrobia bacterium]|nr:hypothetical protein [bacterium]MCG2715430.1 hypothetical protein [Candidatus Neomarinimicrobiota bacterium]